MWCWHHHHIFSCISCFSWSGVHQMYAKWVLVGCGIEFPIQRMLLVEIWVKPHGDKLKIRVEKVVYFFFSSKIWWGKVIFFYYFHYYFIISLRRPILDLKIQYNGNMTRSDTICFKDWFDLDSRTDLTSILGGYSSICNT